eukprot:CAMPEP_0181124152 /NCGR_PEP_ID=MMETSP1071-20121207/26311_1 /TAXON_ID=35127 /ORGANISM="Thalassiosira sp., Strain NH16" /LENGTH=739 /DNA_ID=CAMNT_0023209403 /DNA_START=190 /DNA_END=2409 /DNA_ORIENTATION=-
MASEKVKGTTALALVGIEDTTPQTQHFNSIREEFDEHDEEFIDIDVNDEDDDDNGQEMREEECADGHEDERDDSHLEMAPLLVDTGEDRGDVHREDTAAPGVMTASHSATNTTTSTTQIRSRRNKAGSGDNDGGTQDKHKPLKLKLSCLKRKMSRGGGLEYERMDDQYTANLDDSSQTSGGAASAMACVRMRRLCRESSTHFLRTTVTLMNFLARILLWGSFIAMIVGVVWYSRELNMNGTDPHLIAWFSAGAFVLLGFPISMCGIIMHLKNYYQPNVQCYVVRILWMVPIYSIESWLCLRFHTLAIYIETLRDCYESYVLYSFFQYLIEVLGGEEALVLMLKDKSPTRGAHIWGLGYCVKPWIMGQPVSRRLSFSPMKHGNIPNDNSQFGPSSPRPIKRIQWTSPFFVKCKFGVLQYVLLKFVSAIFVMVLEMYGLYKEGDFTPRGGYLYICILTNLSQCWALYCLVFFYYALKNELGPIRPVGKFLSVKALVFFTWWQSLGISILFQMGMIPHYTSFDTGREWTSDAVAKGLQDWLICIEMFCAAIVHTFVFPHTDYLEPLGIVKQRADHHVTNGVRRLGRKGRHAYRRGDDKSACSKSSSEAELLGGFDLELGSGDSPMTFHGGNGSQLNNGGCTTVDESDKESTGSGVVSGENPRHERQGFVRALLDSTVPRDVLDESVGIFKGDFNVEKKTLLHHAATSDEYDLFSKSSKRRKKVGNKRKIKDGKVPDSVLLND